jgi:hypothetical protein
MALNLINHPPQADAVLKKINRNYLKEVDYVQEQGVDLVLKRSPPEADELLFKTESQRSY